MSRPTPNRTRRGSVHFRLRAAMVLVTVIVSIFAARLVQVQGVDSRQLASRAASAGIVNATLPATRGEIVDRNGTALASSVSGQMIVANPKQTKKNARIIARELADKLGLDYFTVFAALTKEKTSFSYVARRVPSNLATKAVRDFAERKIEGIETRPDTLRRYPGGDVAANLVGFMNANGEPAAGLEQTFNTYLAGKNGRETYEIGGGNRLPLGNNSKVAAVNGKKLTLTIDRDVQWYAQRLLQTKVQQSRADSGAAVVMDVRTGEILALADAPTIDSNEGSSAPVGDWGSRALSAPFEPGSVEKTLTVASLLNEGLVNPQTKITVPSSITPQGAPKPIKDYFTHGTLRLTLAGVIALSSNIGTVLAAQKISSVTMDKYLRNFGLGSFSSIGIPGESAGVLPAGQTWTELAKATMSFGQGMSANAVQMTGAINTLANGGEYVSPSLVKGAATTNKGKAIGTDESQRRRVVSQATATKVSRMMELVTTKGKGTAPGAKVTGYRTAGKTGTAQAVGKGSKTYNQYDVSFAGFAPADKPRFTVYVVIRNPKGAASGGGTAGPVFQKLMTYALQKYDVPPTQTPESNLPVYW